MRLKWEDAIKIDHVIVVISHFLYAKMTVGWSLLWYYNEFIHVVRCLGMHGMHGVHDYCRCTCNCVLKVCLHHDE